SLSLSLTTEKTIPQKSQFTNYHFCPQRDHQLIPPLRRLLQPKTERRRKSQERNSPSMPTAAAVPRSPTNTADRAVLPVVHAAAAGAAPVMMTTTAEDAILSWFRGEFAAANAIIDALCGHLAQVGAAGGGSGGSDYEAVFSAIHRRRLNWIPVLQMQKYHSIADVAVELRRVAERKLPEKTADDKLNNCKESEEEDVKREEDCKASEEVAVEVEVEAEVEESSPAAEEGGESDGTESGEGCDKEDPNKITSMIDLCTNHQDCDARPTHIKLTKGFSAKEHVKGHMVNVVKGLKLFEDVLTVSELDKLTRFVNQLRLSGQNGQLTGDTFILFNKQMKGNKRELIQFGVPIFEHIKEDASNQTCNIEPIPALLEGVINHLVQWHLIPEYRRPNGCIIHFFDEDEFSQPFQKPPHVDQPVATLLLSESTMAFGRTLAGDSDGNYRGPLVLSLKEGSLLVMRGNSADMARHVMCPSTNKRISITFFRVRELPPIQTQSPPTSPMSTGALTLWQPTTSIPYNNGYETMDTMAAKWGSMVRAPVVMLAPMARPVMVTSKRMMPQGGTGVFLPWAAAANSTRKPAKQLPPRAQRAGRYLALPSAVVETRHVADSTTETAISVGGVSP
ncbi:RNA demethylase ALKBH10B, partial [Linum grandiflorum]